MELGLQAGSRQVLEWGRENEGEIVKALGEERAEDVAGWLAGLACEY
jgi:hypothetical protein